MNSFARDKEQQSPEQQSPEATARWDFLTNHAHVLLSISRDRGIRLREIAAAVGITERSAHKILSELVEEGYVLRERHGRRNRYKVKPELPLRHPLVQDREVGDLLNVLSRPERPARNGDRRTRARNGGRVRSRRGESSDRRLRPPA